MDIAQEWLSPKEAGKPATPVLGTMNFGGRTSEAEAARIMEQALDRGVDWFDTANAYNAGESERIIGRFLKMNRKKVRIATKGGLGPGGDEGLSAPVLRAALDASLERLGLEHIDVYYLHAPDRASPLIETLEVLESAQAAGKIGAWGVSNFASWRIAEINKICSVLGWKRPRVSQVIYNLLIRQLDIEYFDFAYRDRIHTTVYNPLAGGLLAGKDLDTIEPGSRFDKNTRYQKRYLSKRMREHTKSYLQLAHDAGIDPVRMAYAWLAHHPGVDSVLLGPATVEQLDQGVQGCMHHIEQALADKIDQIHLDFLGSDAAYAR